MYLNYVLYHKIHTHTHTHTHTPCPSAKNPHQNNVKFTVFSRVLGVHFAPPHVLPRSSASYRVPLHPSASLRVPLHPSTSTPLPSCNI